MIEMAVNRGSSDFRNAPSLCPASIASQRRLNAAAADRLFHVRRLVIDELTNQQRKVRVLAEELCLGTDERADRRGGVRLLAPCGARAAGRARRNGVTAFCCRSSSRAQFTAASWAICLIVVAAKLLSEQALAASRMRSCVEEESATGY
jgi:hypothetical protein